MKKATLIHVEVGVEYYKDGELHPINPSAQEKLLWSLFGLPENITRLEQTFETEIDEFTGFTKREIEAKLDENFKKGVYSFLPPMGINQSIELRWGN